MQEPSEGIPFNRPPLYIALIPIGLLIVLLGINVFLFGEDSSYGSNQVALLLASLVAGISGLQYGREWNDIYEGIRESISSALEAILILLMIGALAGTWLMSGIIPGMIYYGLKVLSPEIFLFACCIICSAVSIATGSSWGTVATVGIAMVGMGQALGIPIGWVAGSIISGAYFGDKLSPLSDTTNLAPAVAGTDLFRHIRHMLWTTVPSISIALIVYIIVGISYQGTYDQETVDTLTRTLDDTFQISPFLFLVPAVVILLIVRKVPALPALFIGVLLGGLFALFYQPDIVASYAPDAGDYWNMCYVAMVKAIALDTAVVTPDPLLNDLLSAGGMQGMMNTIWLIVCALTFGGVMQACGFLQRITDGLLTMAKSKASLITTTAGTCLFFNLTASDQYLAIVVPGKMFSDTFKDKGIAPETLSRTLEDSGTVTSVLIPWNTCGVAQSGVLGVAVLTFAPYCIFNWLSPFMTILFAHMGWKQGRDLSVQNR